MLLKTIEIKTIAHLEAVLKVPIQNIEWVVAQIDQYYTEFQIKKLDSQGQVIKTRTINPSIQPLRSIQEGIQKNILSKMPLPNVVMGGVKKRDNILNAKVHQGNKYKFATDLKSFFPRISNKMVFDMFLSNGFSGKIASLLTKLTTYKGNLPQGAPTSTAIANLVFAKTDVQLMAYCAPKGICYTRFVDDLFFSAKSDFRADATHLIDLVLKDDFQISRKKTFYTSGIAETTGVRIENNGICITADFKNTLENTETSTASQIKGRLMYQKRVESMSLTKTKNVKSFLFDAN